MVKLNSIVKLGAICLFFVVIGVLVTGAQGKAHPKVDQAKVDAAINKGTNYLLECVERGLPPYNTSSGSFRFDDLVLYTLVHGGVSEDDPTFKKLLETVLESNCERTYCIALKAMALEAIDRIRYRWDIAYCAQFLVDNQLPDGLWSYGEGPVDWRNKKAQRTGTAKPKPSSDGTQSVVKKGRPIKIKQRKNGSGIGDYSNTQYAALGLRACLDSNIRIPKEVLKKALKAWEGAQAQDGGWAYHPIPTEHPYGTMTAGGLSSVAIYKHFLKQKIKGDRSIKRAKKWIIDNFDVTKAPKGEHNRNFPEKNNLLLYYYLYALERAGMLAEIKTFGKHDWYAEGAEYILNNQQANGSWKGERREIASTCFAILFLRRATKPLKPIITK